MLSSGTLNLKFMQRNNSQLKKPKLEDDTQPMRPPTHSSISLSDGQQIKKQTQDLADPKGKRKHADQSLANAQSHAPRMKIIYEESLMGFPLLSASSSSSQLSNSAAIASNNVGRRSYGQFNKAIEKLGQTSTTSNRAGAAIPTNQRQLTSHSERINTSSQQELLDSRHSHPSSGPAPDSSKRAKPPQPSSSAARITSTEQTIRTSTKSSGFQKPFKLTSIKSKRKPIELSTSTTESNNSPSTSHRKKKARKDTDAEQKVDEAHKDDSSDDNEEVNQQIERMFLEARKSRKTEPLMNRK